MWLRRGRASRAEGQSIQSSLDRRGPWGLKHSEQGSGKCEEVESEESFGGRGQSWGGRAYALSEWGDFVGGGGVPAEDRHYLTDV